MLENKIKFIATTEEMTDVWPHPQPAQRFISEDYKKLERFEKGDLHKQTVKTCMPFLDSMTAGYIIPFDQDYVVDPTENDLSVTPASREQNQFGFHVQNQLPKPWHKTAGENAGKFIGKWLIKTPPGYSCLFMHPMNRLEERWRMIEGIVDTDSYISVINYPFILKKRDNQFLIKKGDPMIQVVPFKREPWKMWSGFYLEKEHSKTDNKLTSLWKDRYKNLFWKKKSFK